MLAITVTCVGRASEAGATQLDNPYHIQALEKMLTKP